MPPVKLSTFAETYSAYKNYYIAGNGSNKFEKIFDIVNNSEKINEIFRWSISNKKAPTSKDILIIIHMISYFIIAKNETRAMGAFVALYLWNERVNRVHNFASEQDMADKLKSVFGQLSMLY